MFSTIKQRNLILFTLLVFFCTAGLGSYLIYATDKGKPASEMVAHLIIGITVSSTLAILLALWLSSLIVRPVKKLTEYARIIEAGKFGREIIPSSTDEIGELTLVFKNMAARLEETVALITTERDRLSVMLSQLGDAIFIIDEQNQILLSNPAAEKIFQFPLDKMTRHTFIEVVHDFELDAVVQKCKDTRKQQSNFIESRPTKQFLGIIATPLPGKNEYLIVIQDLTRLRMLETVRRDFVANISHELRTPVASLKALTETLLEGAIENKEVARGFLDKINTEVDKMAQLIQELAELSRIESGQAVLYKNPTGINEVVEHAVARLRSLAERSGLILKTDVYPELPQVLIDKERIEQVLLNLIHNAIKFTPPGGNITVSTRRSNNQIIVSVTDTGIGISEDDLPRIFERFYKTDKSRRTGGTGLGLSIAKHIIQAHGGEIRVTSRVGQGSTFSFNIPISS